MAGTQVADVALQHQLCYSAPVSSTSSFGGFGPGQSARAFFFRPGFFRNASTEGHRVDIVYFTITAVVLYVVADRVLDALERRAGHRFEQRSLIFFAILLGMALVTFAVIRQWSGGG
ncbi:MAG TPA: hypothetical protein VK052_04565 [Zeimonas sp.]|nr:hypothetical protein [Zeimonas sp.]